MIGLPRKLNTCVKCFPTCLLTSATASVLSGTGIARRAFAGSVIDVCQHESSASKRGPLAVRTIEQDFLVRAVTEPPAATTLDTKGLTSGTV